MNNMLDNRSVTVIPIGVWGYRQRTTVVGLKPWMPVLVSALAVWLATKTIHLECEYFGLR